MPNYLDDLSVPTLGVLVWYYVDMEASIGFEEFRELIKENEAPIKVTKKPRPEHVFRRATEHCQFETMLLDGQVTVYTKDDGYNKASVNRSLYVSVNSNVGNVGRLDTHIGVATMDKASKTIKVEAKVGAPAEHLKILSEAKDRIMEYYDYNIEAIWSLPIRQSIQSTISENLMGIPIKESGGLYFVPRSKFDDFERMVETMSAVHGVEIGWTPVLKDNDVNDDNFAHNLSTFWMIKEVDILNRITKLRNEIKQGVLIKAKPIQEIETQINELKAFDRAHDWCHESFKDAIDEIEMCFDKLISEIK